MLIEDGGRFLPRDGVVFGNYERRLALPARATTANTPSRPWQPRLGARRIVAGSEQEYYYTDDHYRSFRRIRE